jgi:hypothetical protein
MSGEGYVQRALRAVIWLGLLGCHSLSSPAQDAIESRQTTGVESQKVPEPSVHQLPAASPCESTSGDAPSAELASAFVSPQLKTVSPQLMDAVAHASAAMTGAHKTLTTGGIAGVDFVLARFALKSGGCLAALRAAMTLQESDASAARVTRLADNTADAIDKTFDGWRRSTNSRATPDPTPTLAAEVAQAVGSLTVYNTAGQRDSSHVSGVALVDEATREAIWIFARVVEPIVERRR